jgi:mRNA interferase MazF
MVPAQRAHIYRIQFDPEIAVLGLIVSADWLNAQSDEYMVAQVTASGADQRGMPGSVRLTSGDPAFGYIVCRDVGMVDHEEVKEDLGEVSMETMNEVSNALKLVLSL